MFKHIIWRQIFKEIDVIMACLRLQPYAIWPHEPKKSTNIIPTLKIAFELASIESLSVGHSRNNKIAIIVLKPILFVLSLKGCKHHIDKLFALWINVLIVDIELDKQYLFSLGKNGCFSTLIFAWFGFNDLLGSVGYHFNKFCDSNQWSAICTCYQHIVVACLVVIANSSKKHYTSWVFVLIIKISKITNFF